MLTVIYDVHGNLPALEAVLDDARTAGAGGYVLGGDCVQELARLPGHAGIADTLVVPGSPVSDVTHLPVTRDHGVVARRIEQAAIA